ncbi:MAG: outer membrane protein OmpA-like peptidoglycan-associated protein [Bacteroidia bacterium]|jgi:outer membrane protein OmpA-like peptidoglycan-associated protein
MGSKRIVPIFLFIGLLVSGSYYYLCKIKQVCDGVLINIKSDVSDTMDTSNQALRPMSFRHNSAEPILGVEFDSMRATLLNKLGDQDTLIIYAVYYDGESGGEDLATERVENVKSLLVDHFDVTRLLTEVNYDGVTRADENANLEAVQFTIVSNKMDDAESESDYEEEVIPTPSVERFTDKGIIHFPKGSVRKLLTPEVVSYIDEIVVQLNNDPNLKVYVEGHSDNEGDEDRNHQLGRKRAWVVKKLIWDKGIEPIRIVTSSKGELEPIKDNDTEEGRSYNRRVEVTIKAQ